jgi:general secretion pathway protein E
MVGEIRDKETAVMAIQSALTGHLVFSTLHTNDASSAVTRLLDLGIEPYLLSSSLVGVLAQRLVRKVCRSCAGKGCESCRKTGYAGRVGVFELLTVNDGVRRRIQERATAADIKTAAVTNGMRTLRDDGMAKATAGVTTIEEVQRVTMRAET